MTPLNPGERSELERQGAKAAARGDSIDDNPMLRQENQPGSTGETQRVWSTRRDAWQEGYDAQHDEAVPQDVLVHAARRNATVERVLLSTTRLLTFAGERPLTAATGFFFSRDRRLYVVTSRHVLFDGPSGHMPDRVEMDLHTDEHDLSRWTTFLIPLYRDGVAAWHQAQDGGGDVDVAVLELDIGALPTPCVMEAFTVAHLPGEHDEIDVGDSLAIPGFPLGFHDTAHHLPVVRHAAMASSHGVRFQGQGFFLTDGRTHRGTSGAPVLCRRAGPAGGSRWLLVGVHSSRMDMTRDKAQDESLGLNCAWYADILLTLTAAPVAVPIVPTRTKQEG